MEELNHYIVHYKHGLMKATAVDAVDEEDAAKRGLALYRKNSTAMDNWPIDFVVDHIESMA